MGSMGTIPRIAFWLMIIGALSLLLNWIVQRLIVPATGKVR